MKSPKFARFVYAGGDQSLFSSTNNPDGLKDKWISLFNSFRSRGVELHFSPPKDETCLFELHLNVHSSVMYADRPAYVILLEDSHVYPLNGKKKLLALYEKVFTWNDLLVDGKKFFKITFSPRFSLPPIDGFIHRPSLCCMIAANKSLPIYSGKDLYKERVKAIRWFEEYAPLDFELYGGGWECPPRWVGFAGKVQSLLYKRMLLDKACISFPSWRGRVASKKDVLSKTRFTIAYENVRNVPGYITEKIFDAFSSGCVPVYWGANNIIDYIPSNCFIDREKFLSMKDLYQYLSNMEEEEFKEYQGNIVEFLNSSGAEVFLSKSFANAIQSEIFKDFTGES